MNSAQRILRLERMWDLPKEHVLETIAISTIRWVTYKDFEHYKRHHDCDICNFTKYLMCGPIGITKSELDVTSTCSFCFLPFLDIVLCQGIQKNLNEKNFQSYKRSIIEASHRVCASIANENALENYASYVKKAAIQTYERLEGKE